MQGPSRGCLVLRYTMALALCPAGLIRAWPSSGDLLCSIGVFIVVLEAWSLEMSVGNGF